MSFLSSVQQHVDAQFIKRLFLMALPIALQNMMFSSRSLVDVMMLGQLGESEIAAVGVAARATFVTTIMIVGVTTGGALLTAQYWGANNREGVRRSTALTWFISLLFALATTLLFVLVPDQIMGLATTDPQVIALGRDYLVICSISMVWVACVASMAAGLRAVHQPGTSTFFSGIGIASNVFLNWVLIFGNLGFPALGIKGAAIATVLSGAIEVATLFGYLYIKKHLLAFSIQDIQRVLVMEKVTRFLKLSMPTTLNFLAWAGGLFAYHAIMGRSSVQGLAALSVMSPVESMSLAFVIGLASAGSVFVGNQLGAKRYEQVYYQAWVAVFINLLMGVVLALFVYGIQQHVLGAFSALSEETRHLAEQFYVILCFGLVIRSVPLMMIVGVLRAGGDVKYCLYQDLVAQWCIGIPLAAVAAIWFGVEPQWVYLLFLIEEVVKWGASGYRLVSRKWINNLIES